MTKRIKDSVHGNILVDDDYIKCIIDTPSFQRLRRIEQTAIRSIFPSARHDRFIHSLGVYYIGKLIVDHLHDEVYSLPEIKGDTSKQEVINRIENSYKVACLLHDIGHAPFSHTFEKYFGSKKQLFDILNKELDSHLSNYEENLKSTNYHEYTSAIVVCKEFKEKIVGELKADLELVCRMIIGAKYPKSKENCDILNCYISLLHGDVIDADRMDYACRDVWASGYSTSSIDVDRVVNAIHIKKPHNKSELKVCFDCNALTEITNMLDVRQFQNRRVINHHTVQYEQNLMVMAAQKAASKHFGIPDGDNALRKLINISNCHNGKYLSDEDVLKLIKDDGNDYYKEFASRKYKRFAIWKTPDEFFYYFPDVPRKKDLEHSEFESRVKSALSKYMDPEDIIFLKVKYNKRVDLRKLYVVVNKQIVRYTDIHPELQVDLGNVEHDIHFYYVYVPKPEDGKADYDELRKKYVEALRPELKNIYPQSNAEFTIYDYIQSALIKSYELLDKDKIVQIDLKKKLTQIENMSDEVNRLYDFLTKSGVDEFINKYSTEEKEN